MLLYVSDPLMGISELLTLLQIFGRVSSCGVDLWESELVPVTFIEWKNLGPIPFKVSFEKYRYLGIRMARDCGNLCGDSYLALMANTGWDIAKWWTSHLSMFIWNEGHPQITVGGSCICSLVLEACHSTFIPTLCCFALGCL